MATSTPTDEASSPHPGSYPEMIMDALATSTLDGAEGLPRSAISKHVEAARGGDLSPSHDASLGAHLARMVEDGEIVRMPNGNYAPTAAAAAADADDAAAPPRRGRGRPPKLKAPGPRRPRGRPPKPRDPLAPAKASRPRGRPPKNGAASTEEAETAEDGAAAKRPRGRPPKVRPQFAEVGFV